MATRLHFVRVQALWQEGCDDGIEAQQIGAHNRWKPVPFTDSTIIALKQYAWPGNIRKSRNVVERLLLLAGAVVDAGAVQLALPSHTNPTHPVYGNAEPGSTPKDTGGALAERMLNFERAEVLKELGRHNRHIS
jgi:DNA-binding NtrC family response regulator